MVTLSCSAHLQGASLVYTLRCDGAVCWCILQHRPVVKLVVLHCVIREQAPAHTQGCLSGRVGHLGIDYWGRWSWGLFDRDSL